MVRRATSSRPISMVSVSSSVRLPGVAWWRCSTCSTWDARLVRVRSRPQMLTCMPRCCLPGLPLFQRASWAIAWSMIQSVSASIWPDSSASAMNTAGLMAPRCGCTQRARASKPLSR
jgi:hypothetical protein